MRQNSIIVFSGILEFIANVSQCLHIDEEIAKETHSECDFQMACWIDRHGHSAMECYDKYSKNIPGITTGEICKFVIRIFQINDCIVKMSEYLFQRMKWRKTPCHLDFIYQRAILHNIISCCHRDSKASTSFIAKLIFPTKFQFYPYQKDMKTLKGQMKKHNVSVLC